MVDVDKYKEFIKWFKERKENFTVSDVHRETSISPKTINKIIEKLAEGENPYIKIEGVTTNKKYIKLRDVDLDFFVK